MENEHAECEAAEAKRHLQEYAINREEERLGSLEQIRVFRRIFALWKIGQREDRALAGERAIRAIEAILRDDEEQMILALDALAFHLGYRIKKGRFDD